jgi:hypothetical protein
VVLYIIIPVSGVIVVSRCEVVYCPTFTNPEAVTVVAVITPVSDITRSDELA